MDIRNVIRFFISVFLLIVLLLMVTALSGCHNPDYADQWKGEHRLRKMTVDKYVGREPTTTSGFFILGTGGVSTSGGSASLEQKVTFAWEDAQGVYVISQLDVRKLQVKLKEEETEPTVRFSFSESGYCESSSSDWDANSVVQSCAKNARITVRPEDWRYRVDLPLNSNH